MNKRYAAGLLAGLLALPGLAAVPAKPSAKTKAAVAKPAGPDDLTAPSIRHTVVCPPPKFAPCVMQKPIAGGYRVLTNGVDIGDNGTNWVVDFGKGPKGEMFLLQVLDASGDLHDIAVTFRVKSGMQKTPTLPEE